MLVRMTIRALVLVATLLLAACGGGGRTVPANCETGGTCPPPPCAIIAVIDSSLMLISPAKNATGVSTTVGTITFSSAFSYATLTLSPHDGTAQLTGLPVTAANGVQSVPVPALHAGVVYDVQVLTAPSAGPGCTSTSIQYAGSFTTQ
jgi:hypothetical protein